GDIESLPYVEAVRQLKWEMGNDCVVVHLTLVPYLAAAGELKTKPTQHSVKALLEPGVQPDILVCRTEHELTDDLRQKIARFCNVGPNAVIESIDAKTIYDVPILMEEEELDCVVMEKLGLPTDPKGADLTQWRHFLKQHKNPTTTVKIGLVGKYIELKDAYKSIVESFIHAGAENGAKVDLVWLHSEDITPENVADQLSGLQGLLVAPGFGERGIDGKIEAIRYARETGLPFLGICLGMQCAVIEFARNVLDLKDAHTTEINENAADPVIDLMDGQKNLETKGGTMRLGAYQCAIMSGSMANKVYQKDLISERHRHRYEFNNKYLEAFQANGMIASGINPESQLVEIVEIPEHPFFMGVQFHPEYKSTVAAPHALFVGFVKAAVKSKKVLEKA
ncbi:MAG: CTP synthase, partial [Cryomorphaceae bacterium]